MSDESQSVGRLRRGGGGACTESTAFESAIDEPSIVFDDFLIVGQSASSSALVSRCEIISGKSDVTIKPRLTRSAKSRKRESNDRSGLVVKLILIGNQSAKRTFCCSFPTFVKSLLSTVLFAIERESVCLAAWAGSRERERGRERVGGVYCVCYTRTDRKWRSN
jgi:hypothetical protein